MNVNNRFKDRLKYLRSEKEMTGEELGKVFEVTKVGIHGWESGNRSPNIDMLIKIADYFDVSLDYLLGRADYKNVKIFNELVDGKQIKTEAIGQGYPDGMTHDEVLRILENVRQVKVLMKEFGVKFE